MKPSEDTNRMANAVEDAELAFWAEIVKHYPEAKHGDFAPDAAFALANALNAAVVHWVENNVDSMYEGEVEVLFHNIAYSFEADGQDINNHIEQIAYEIVNGSKSGRLFLKDWLVEVGEWEIDNG